VQYAFVRLGAVLLAAFLLLPAIGPGAEQAFACGPVHPKTGDLNADGVANSLDALAILEYQAGMVASEPDEYWMGGADVNCDMTVNAVDATLILQADAGLTTIRP
jgi:hypothetical protein